MTALHPRRFTEDSTLFHMGMEQAKTEFRDILTFHLRSA